MYWTQERINRMKALNAEGYSAAQIAADLGGISRNAVIGKMRRLGVASSNPNRARRKVDSRGRPPKTPPPSMPKVSAPEDPEVHGEPIAQPLPVKGPPGGVLLDELNSRTCRYPLGDPRNDGFAFCGAPCDPADAYCAAHALVCYSTPDRVDPGGLPRKESM